MGGTAQFRLGRCPCIAQSALYVDSVLAGIVLVSPVLPGSTVLSLLF